MRFRGALLLFAILLLPCEASEIPGVLPMLEGKSTVVDCRLAAEGALECGSGDATLQLSPDQVDHRARLVGLFDLGRNRLAAILAWTDPPVSYVWTHRFQLFRGTRKGHAARVGTFALQGGPEAAVRFYRPPDARDTPKIVVDVTGGAAWGTSYLLPEEGSTARKLFEASAYDFVDLNADGVYELVSWNRRPNAERCRFGMFAVRVSPEVHRRSGSAYEKIWPPTDSGWTQAMALLADLDGDGSAELAALTDTGADTAGAQQLAVFKLKGNAFQPIAQAALPWPRIAYWIESGRGTEIRVSMAARSKCEAGGDPKGTGTGVVTYRMRAGRLERSAPPR